MKWMDLAGVPYQYEPGIVELAGEPPIRYDPDFWLDEFRATLEAKGEIWDDPTGLKIIEKCRRLAKQSGRPVILCFHDILDARCVVFHGDRMYSESRWTMCRWCGSVAIGIRKADGPVIWCPKKHEDVGLDLPSRQLRSRFLYEAAITARQARFGWPRKKSA